MKQVARFKPSALLFEQKYDEDKSGLLALSNVLESKNVDLRRIVKLMVKYPALLTKTEDDLNEYF